MAPRDPTSLRFEVMSGEFGIAHLRDPRELAKRLDSGEWVSVTRTRDEVSIIGPGHLLSDLSDVSRGWALLRLQGPFEFDEIGIMSVVSGLLAEAEIPLLALSTFRTDYFLVPRNRLEEAVRALRDGGLRKLS